MAVKYNNASNYSKTSLNKKYLDKLSVFVITSLSTLKCDLLGRPSGINNMAIIKTIIK